MKTIILDVDTGSDDAVAIITAAFCDTIEIAAICTTSCLPIETTTANTLKVLHLIGRDIPVYQGAAEAMVKGLSPHRLGDNRVNPSVEYNGRVIFMHDAFELAPSPRQPEPLGASLFYLEYFRNAATPTTVVITAPATNLALAMVMDPSIAKNIEEIVMMCGGYKQANVTSCAESNAWRDPEAVHILMNCGAKVTLVSLDATHSAALNRADVEKLQHITSPAAAFCCAQIEKRMLLHRLKQPLQNKDAVAVHDPLCIAYLAAPEVITDIRACHCEIDCSDGPAQGQTIVDSRYFTAPPNVRMAFEADRERYVRFLVDSLQRTEITQHE